MIDFGNNETFIENYKKLKSSRKMGELYGCSKNSITKHAKKIGYDYSQNKEVKITNVPVEQVYLEYLELKSCKKVGEKYGCSDTAVRNYLISNGYELTNFNSKLSSVTEKEFIDAYNELKSAQKMGEKYNCSSTAILNYAQKIGYDTNSNKHYKLSEQDKKEILEAYYSDITSTELAEKYNVSRGMITKLWYDTQLSGKVNRGGESSIVDITGQKFGKWTVLYKTNKRNSAGIIYWHCKCECGVERDVLGNSLRSGLSQSCGAHSNISRGNEKIKQLLIQNNIPFEAEKKFNSCRDKSYLPFDFYVNNQYLIEYDGEQHYDEDSVFDYEYTHKHDLIKSQWCKDNNIPLIRIPYTHFKQLSINDLILETSIFVEK